MVLRKHTKGGKKLPSPDRRRIRQPAQPSGDFRRVDVVPAPKERKRLLEKSGKRKGWNSARTGCKSRR